jgi:hypothetical protein
MTRAPGTEEPSAESSPTRREGPKRGGPLRRWPEAATVAVLILSALAGLIYLDILYPAALGPRQPIPFSHRVHVHSKKLSCFMCHSEVLRSSRAGIPALETCLLCHARVIRSHPYIAKLRQHAARNQPVIWERVNWVPEFVYFDHSVHIHRGFDCGACHGEVSMMDRVVKAREFQMGFCIQCHRENKATTDCFTCHR